MKLTKEIILDFIKEELKKTNLNEAINSSAFSELSSNDQDIRNDFEAAKQLARSISGSSDLESLDKNRTKSYLKEIKREQQELKQRLKIAISLKENIYSDVNNIENLRTLIINLTSFYQAIAYQEKDRLNFTDYDQARDDRSSNHAGNRTDKDITKVRISRGIK